MTSFAESPPAIDEPVSPELALVDPELRERLLALLPEIELEPPPPVLRALPDPKPEESLALTPPPELVEGPVVVHVPAPLEAPVAHLAALPVRPAPVYVFPTRGERVRSFAKAFVLGAAAATVITVGVVAELGDGSATPQDPVTAPPTVATPVPAPAPSDTSGTGSKTAKQTQRTGGAETQGKTPVGKSATAQKTKAAAGKSATAKKTKAAADKSATAKKQQKTQKSTGTAAAASSEPRRFAWAPADGAVGYRLELFRGDRQVFETRTKQPFYELAGRWRHDGRTETLTKGEYRWYVWPVLANGQSGTAVVQAQLSVP